MNGSAAAKPPPSFWVITILGLIWNGFGAYLYLLSKFDLETALAGASPEMRDYVISQPVWANAAYALGIWGSMAGSVLMVLRSRYAVPAFAASLAGAVASFFAQALAGVIQPGLAIFILLVIAFLWHYSRRSAAQGLLR